MRANAASFAKQSDPEFNRHFNRRWSETAPRVTRASAEPIRLVEIPGAFDRDGNPRAALSVPPAQHSANRRPVLMMFANVAAAVAAKASMERGV